MFERFTVDTVADVIATKVMTGEGDAKLSHRFFRKGRRDGFRSMGYQPIATTIDAARRTAASRIEQAHLTTKVALERQLAKLDAERTILLEGTKDGRPERPGVPASPDDDPGGNPLEYAAEVQARRQDHAIQMADYERRLAKFEADSNHLVEVQLDIDGLTEELQALEPRYEQQSTTCFELGQFLWSRYVSGYEYGQTRLLRRLLFRNVDRRDLPGVLPSGSVTVPVGG